MSIGTKRWAIMGLGVATLLAVVSWFLAGYTNKSNDQTKVRVAVSLTPLSTPIFIADALGYFDQVGLDVELVEVIGGKRSFERLMSGGAEFATSSDSVIVFKGFKRDDFVNLATFVQSDNDVKIIVNADGGIKNAADLVGQRVAVIKGSASEYFLSLWLGLSGIDISQVKLVPTNPEDMPKMLADRQVAAIVPWEPYSYQAVQLLGGEAKVFHTKGLYPLTFNLIARKAYAEQNPQVSQQFLQALDMAINYMAQQPEQAQRTLRERLGLEEDFVRWVWGDYLFKLSLGRSLLLTLENQATWALSTGQTDASTSPNFAALIDARPLSAIKPTAVTIHR